MTTLTQIYNLIKNSNKLAVFGHQSVDADCLGSMSAIYFLIKSLNKHVDAFCDDDKVNSRYGFMNYTKPMNGDITEKYDTVISVDVASSRLLGKYKDYFLSHKNSIVIDHHKNRDLIGTHVYVDSEKSACCEILFELVKTSGVVLPKQVATNIYAGVADDTGCFMHDNTNQNTHKCAFELIELGADLSVANYNLFKLTSEKEFELRKLLLNMVEREDGVTYCCITDKFLKENKCDHRDIGDFVSELINLQNTKIAFLITEKVKHTFSVSFRSLQGYDVSSIANKFGGGGHAQASGCSVVSHNCEDVKQSVLKLCLESIKE